MNFKECFKSSKEKLAYFIELTRGYSLLTSVAPWFLAASSAAVAAHFYTNEKLYFINLILTFLVVICLHLGGNLFDDYMDVKMQLEKGIPLNNINFEHAKNKAALIINGTFSLAQVRKIIFKLFVAAAIIGIYFTSLYGAIIPIIALITGGLCLFYPLSSKMYLGELVIGLIFGPLLITGTYIALSGIYLPKMFILSIAVALMIIVLLDTHSLMDFDYDKKNNKKTLCTLTGTKNRALALIAGEIAVAYLIIIYLVLSKQFSFWIILSVIITLPLAVKLIKSLDEYNKVIDLKFIPRWYLGPMENWELIKKCNCEYFMYRFYIARNLGFIFCLILAFVCYFTMKTTYVYI